MYWLRASNYLRDGVPCHGRHARITGDLWQADLVLSFSVIYWDNTRDSKVHEANKGPIWGRQDPGGPHVGPMNLAIRDLTPNNAYRVELFRTHEIYLYILTCIYYQINITQNLNIHIWHRYCHIFEDVSGHVAWFMLMFQGNNQFAKITSKLCKMVCII